MPEHSIITTQPQTVAAATSQVMPAQEPLKEDPYKEALQYQSIQRKLSIGAVDDPLENEADDMADAVMRMPEQPFVQRKCNHCEEDIQRKPSASITPFIQAKGEGGGTASDGVTSQVNAAKGSGSNMDRPTQSFMESRFGTDFSHVKIHTGDNAVQMSRELNAQAFTVGNDIYFNSGKYNPSSDSGKHLLAHELTHTVQQGGFSEQKQIQKQVRQPEEEMGTDFPSGIEISFNRMEWDDKLAVELAAAITPFGDELSMLLFFLIFFILAGAVAAAYLEPVLLFIGMEFPIIYAWIMANLATIAALAEAAGLSLAVTGLAQGTSEISDGLLMLQRGVSQAASMRDLRNYGAAAGRLFARGIGNLALSAFVLNQWFRAGGIVPPRTSPVRSTASPIPVAEDAAETAAAGSDPIVLPPATGMAAPPEPAIAEPAVTSEPVAGTEVLPATPVTGMSALPESAAAESSLVSEPAVAAEIEVEVLDSAAAEPAAESTAEVTQSLLAEPLTPYEMFRTLVSETVFRGRIAAGRIIHHGGDTRVIIQILDADGGRVLVAIGRNSSPVHAEDAIIRRILTVIENYRARLAGGEIQVVVNQHVCSECITDLTTFAADYDIARVTSHIFRRTALRGEGMASPRTTFSTIASPSVEGSIVEVTDTVLYQRPGS